MRPSLRLSTRLGVSHGLLVLLLVVCLGVTLQGVVRMLSLIVEIRDQRLSSIDVEEELHNAAWEIEVSLRHGRAACMANARDSAAATSIARKRAELVTVLKRLDSRAFERLRSIAERYLLLANVALAGDTCVFLLSTMTDEARAALDEEATDVWITRLRELHADIQQREDVARRIGNVTAVAGVTVAFVAAVAAVGIARATGRSVAKPIQQLGSAATRLGEGNFAPIPPVIGPREVEDLWRDLERARARLLEIDELKQSFLASVSHEMRTPLTSVRAALALLSDETTGGLNEQQRRVVLLAKRACEREVRIVEAMLDLSRFRSGMPLKREAACDIDLVLAAAVDAERDDAERRGVRIDSVAGERVPTIHVDSALLERAIANLLRNAVSVSRDGQCVRIERGIRGDDVPTMLSVDVVDEGPGLASELDGVLFRPFTAAPVERVGRPAGLGIGLAFAREVARAHGGDITVHRSDASGTMFRLAVPVDTNGAGA